MSLNAILDAERSHSFTGLVTAVQNYWMTHPTSSFFDLEMLLRGARSRTFLIARKTRGQGDSMVSFETGVSKPFTNTPIENVDGRSGLIKRTPFYIWITSKGGPDLLQELLLESSSYAENLEKLKQTGIQQVSSDYTYGTAAGSSLPRPLSGCFLCNDDHPDGVTCPTCDIAIYCSTTCQLRDQHFHSTICAELGKQKNTHSLLATSIQQSRDVLPAWIRYARKRPGYR